MDSEAYEKRIAELERVAQTALSLLSPPNDYGSAIFSNKQEREQWKSLRKALIDAGYSWVEYT